MQKPAELAAIMHRRVGRRNFVRPELAARRLINCISEFRFEFLVICKPVHSHMNIKMNFR